MGGFFGIFGVSIVFIIVGIFIIIRTKKIKESCTVKTTATIIEIEERIRHSNEAIQRYEYHPKYEYFVN